MMVYPVCYGIRCQKRLQSTVDFPADPGRTVDCRKGDTLCGGRATRRQGAPGGLGSSLPTTRRSSWL